MGPRLAATGRETGAMIPLAIEAQMLGLAGFATGMVIAYIVELRRRANEWKMKL